jgi:stage II sporulation protein AA (anti-sigma F factor antagonist)
MIRKNCKVDFEFNDNELLIFLEGEIDHYSSVFVRGEIDKKIAQTHPRSAVLVLSGIDFMDSSGIGLVMGRYRNLQRTGATMHITGTSPQITKVMKLAGVGRLAKMDVGGFKVETDK